MVSTEWLEAEVLKAVPDAEVEVMICTAVETTFTFESQMSFEGMRPLQRQKQVLNHMKNIFHTQCMPLTSSAVPEQAAVTGDTAFDHML